MFSEKNVKLYLQKLTFAVDENDTVTATALLYLTPITKPRAESIDSSDDIASSLFNRGGKPFAHLSSIGFAGEPDACGLEYVLHEETKSGSGMIPYVEFSSIHALKLFADKTDWTLAFNMSFECNDKELMWSFVNRLKKTFLASFQKVQGELFPKVIPACAAEILIPGSKETKTCGVSPKYKVPGKAEYYCVEHPRAAGEVDLETLTKDDVAKWAKLHADNDLNKGNKKKGSAKKDGK